MMSNKQNMIVFHCVIQDNHEKGVANEKKRQRGTRSEYNQTDHV